MASILPEGVSGECHPRFAAVAELFGAQLAAGAHGGAAIAVHHRGAPVVDMWGGPGWDERTMAVSFSTTKGVTAICAHMALERAGVGYDTPIAEVWPEFAANGKEQVTIRHALCHEAGIPQIRDEVADVEALGDWERMVEVVAGLSPLWEPGTANGYHALTYGWIVGELVRRVDGRPLPEFLAEEVAGPLGLDGLHIGTPEAEHGRVAPLRAPSSGASLEGLLPPDSLPARALSPAGDITAWLNSPAGLSACAPAVSGAFTARSLARLYAVLERGGELDGVRLLRPETIAAATEVQNRRPDLVLMVPVHWRLGFMSGGSMFSPAGPNRAAYGHSGFGGSLAIADPTAELSVAVVLDRLEVDLLGGDRTRRIVQLAVEAVAQL